MNRIIQYDFEQHLDEERQPTSEEMEDIWLDSVGERATVICIPTNPEYWHDASKRISKRAADILKSKLLDKWPEVEIRIVPELTSLNNLSVGPMKTEIQDYGQAVWSEALEEAHEKN